MSSETENLGLFKYDPVADKDQTFNIDLALNQNWDTVDKEMAQREVLLKSSASKEAIADTDAVAVVDSTDSSKTKRVLWSTIKSALSKIYVPLTRKINSKSLSSDVTLTGADIQVSGTDNTKIDTALSNKVKQEGRLSKEIFDNPTYQCGYLASVDDVGVDMPGIPGPGHWRVLYMPYFASSEGWAAQIAVGAVTNNGLHWRKAHGNTWEDWEMAATATRPQEYELPLVDGFSIPEVGIKNRYYKDQFGRVMVDFAVSGAFNANEHVHIATLPTGFIPSFVAHATAYNYTGEPPVVAVWVDGSGKIFCHASETISGVAGQIEFIAHK